MTQLLGLMTVSSSAVSSHSFETPSIMANAPTSGIQQESSVTVQSSAFIAIGDLSTQAANKTYLDDLIETPAARYTIVTFQIIAIVLASLGNGYLIVLIARNWKRMRRSVTALLVLNLAICDFINVTVYQPMKLADLLVYQPESSEESVLFCKVAGYFSGFFSGVAFLTIVAISQERLLLICFPFKAKLLLKFRNALYVMGGIWLFVALTVLPIPIIFAYVVTIPLEYGNTAICMMETVTEPKKGVAYVWFIFLMYFFLPSVAITATYSWIFKKLHSKSPLYHPTNKRMAEIVQSRKAMAKVMLCISAIFIVSYGPHFLLMLIVTMGHVIPNDPLFTLMIFELLTLISPVMNPVVYSIKGKTIRKGLDLLSAGGRNTQTPAASSVDRASSLASRKSSQVIIRSSSQFSGTSSGAASGAASRLGRGVQRDSSRYTDDAPLIRASYRPGGAGGVGDAGGGGPTKRGDGHPTGAEWANMDTQSVDKYGRVRAGNPLARSSTQLDDSLPLTESTFDSFDDVMPNSHDASHLYKNIPATRQDVFDEVARGMLELQAKMAPEDGEGGRIAPVVERPTSGVNGRSRTVPQPKSGRSSVGEQSASHQAETTRSEGSHRSSDNSVSGSRSSSVAMAPPQTPPDRASARQSVGHSVSVSKSDSQSKPVKSRGGSQTKRSSSATKRSADEDVKTTGKPADTKEPPVGHNRRSRDPSPKSKSRKKSTSGAQPEMPKVLELKSCLQNLPEDRSRLGLPPPPPPPPGGPTTRSVATGGADLDGTGHREPEAVVSLDRHSSMMSSTV